MTPTAPDTEQPTAIVVGLDCITGLQTARILAQRGVPVSGVVADRRHFCARTRYARQLVVAPTSGEALIESLERLAPRLDGPAVLIPCTDGAVLALSRWRDRLGAYRFVLPDHEVVELLMDKVRFAEHATAAGQPIPATQILRSRADAEAAAAALPYPAVVKPALKTPRWIAATKQKAFRVADAGELLAAWDRWSEPAAGVLIAQAWIEGGEDELYSANVYYDREARARVVFIARKLRQWPPETGTSCLGEEVRDDAVHEAALALFDSVGYRGLGYLEVKRDVRTGERLIVEPNVGRPTGRSAIAEAGGVELVYSAYLDALGAPLPAAIEQTYRGVKWIYWRHDVQAAARQLVRGELSPLGWWRSVRGRRWEAVFDPADPRPFAIDVTRTAAAAARAALGRVRRSVAGG